MKTPSDTDHANTGLGERLPRPDEKPTAPPPKPVDTFATKKWLPDGLEEKAEPIVVEDSGDEE